MRTRTPGTGVRTHCRRPAERGAAQPARCREPESRRPSWSSQGLLLLCRAELTEELQPLAGQAVLREAQRFELRTVVAFESNLARGWWRGRLGSRRNCGDRGRSF